MRQPVLWSANSNSFSTDYNINILGNKSYFLQVHTIQVQIVQTEILICQTSKEKQALMLHFGQLLKSKTNKSIKNLHSLELKCKFSALFSFLVFNCCITNKQAMPYKTCLQTYVDREGPDQPAHPYSLIRAFIVP